MWSHGPAYAAGVLTGISALPFGTIMFRKPTTWTVSGPRPRPAVVVVMCVLPVLLWIIIYLMSGKVMWF